jgi:hypothetical protein
MRLKEEDENKEDEVKRNLSQRLPNYLPGGSKLDKSELQAFVSSVMNTIIFPSNK